MTFSTCIERGNIKTFSTFKKGPNYTSTVSRVDLEPKFIITYFFPILRRYLWLALIIFEKHGIDGTSLLSYFFRRKSRLSANNLPLRVAGGLAGQLLPCPASQLPVGGQNHLRPRHQQRRERGLSLQIILNVKVLKYPIA